ncbi:MAG: acyltransferase family protein, partial [Thermocrispum sp.]
TRQPPEPEQAAKQSPIAGFRPDVEGLRAIAVGLVLLYHAGLPFIPGGFVGVDVFFVISGFLITGLLVKEVQRSGTISIGGFYARRAKRLLPAAATVLAATLVLVLAVIPRVSWEEIGGDIVAAALYVVNWRMADRSVDYLAEDSEASPVQHFWSLAVEEQYYLVWPLLLLLVAWWARKRGQTLRHELWIGLAVIAIPSFAWSVYHTAGEPSVAFFVTTTRMWELAIGAAVALGAVWLTKLPQGFAILLGWAGVAAIAASAFVYSTSTAWPGYAAALPTLGTAAVIAAGFAAGPRGPVVLLGTKPFTWIGGLSYSLYLWHWPLIVAAAAYWGGLSPLRGLAVAVLSIIPAWLTLKFVENPIRFSTTTFKPAKNSLKLGAALTAAGVVVGFGLIGITSVVSGGSVHNAKGAAAITGKPSAFQAKSSAEAMVPDPLQATDDVPDAYDKGCQVDVASAEPNACTYGDPDGERTIALVGDSKALQWISALDIIGQEKGWRVVTYTKSACTFADATISQDGKPYATCTQWNKAVTDKLLADKPAVVLSSQGKNKALDDPQDAQGGASQETMVAGMKDRWSELTRAGISVAVLRDNPHPDEDISPVYECVDDHRENLAKCGFDRADGEDKGGGPAQLEAVEATPDVQLVDLNDYLCPGDVCPPVIGDVLVYRQGSHLTKTYVNSLAPRLERKLTPIVDAAK